MDLSGPVAAGLARQRERERGTHRHASKKRKTMKKKRAIVVKRKPSELNTWLSIGLFVIFQLIINVDEVIVRVNNMRLCFFNCNSQILNILFTIE